MRRRGRGRGRWTSSRGPTDTYAGARSSPPTGCSRPPTASQREWVWSSIKPPKPLQPWVCVRLLRRSAGSMFPCFNGTWNMDGCLGFLFKCPLIQYHPWMWLQQTRVAPKIKQSADINTALGYKIRPPLPGALGRCRFPCCWILVEATEVLWGRHHQCKPTQCLSGMKRPWTELLWLQKQCIQFIHLPYDTHIRQWPVKERSISLKKRNINAHSQHFRQT